MTEKSFKWLKNVKFQSNLLKFVELHILKNTEK